jgi:hypothetical protein
MTITVKVGDDISWLGEIKREGITDYTGYTLTAEFRLKDTTTGAPGGLQATADIDWISTAAGTFSLKVPRADTASWPVNACILVDIRIAAPDNTWLRTETAEFMTEAGVTA